MLILHSGNDGSILTTYTAAVIWSWADWGDRSEWLPNQKLSAALYDVVTAAHVDTTDDSPVLSMTFRQAILPYTLASIQWRPADNEPCYTASHCCLQITTYNVVQFSREK